jgi:hypothetical protein
MSSTFLVFGSQSNIRRNNTRFKFNNCCSQSRPNRHRYQIFLFGGDAAGLSVAIRYGASKSYAPNLILQPTIEFSLLFVVITFLSKNLSQVVFMAEILLPSNVESFSPKNLRDLPFDRVIPMLYLVSHILARSTKI